MYRLEIAKPAIRSLRRLPANIAQRIRDKLDELAKAPMGTPRNVRPLKGRPGFRLRVGDWRVVYQLDHTKRVLTVLDVGPRGGIYDR